MAVLGGKGKVFPESCAVAYSGGKDSLVALDLCATYAPGFRAFMMEFLPGMDYTDAVCAPTERRYGIKVHRIIHWGTQYFFRRGAFLPGYYDIPAAHMADAMDWARRELQAEWVVTGHKKCDSLQRRGWLTRAWPNGRNEKFRLYSPVMEWSHRDILSHLNRRNIPLIVIGEDPEATTGLSLSPRSMHFLRQHFPRDYKRVLEVFPFAVAQADRWPAIQRQRAEDEALAHQRRAEKRNQSSAVQPAQNQ